MAKMDTDVEQQVRTALESGINWAFGDQKADGDWTREVLADATFTSEYIFFRQAMGLDLEHDKAALTQWLLAQQQDDGSWSLAPESPGNISATVEAYLALKILGLPMNSPPLLKARAFLIDAGGVARVRFFTRIFLATFGLFPWAAIPQLPVELILMPSWSPVNIYTLASWARSTLVPMLIVRHHQPVYALPNGLKQDNDFLDEIWVNPQDKMIPYTPSLVSLCMGQDWTKLGFTVVDNLIAACGGLKHTPLRHTARQACLKWILQHQEVNGDWAGFWPPVHGSVWALILEGYPMDCKPVVLGLQQMENLSITDSCGKRIQATVSPVWDTVLMLYSLCDAGLQQDPRVVKAIQWVKDCQLRGPEGDWRVYRPHIPTGGWSFEYVNNWYPDVDDSAVAVMALLKYDPNLATSECIVNAMGWILGMQNPDGGWGAFDYGNDKLFLNKIPFSDMDSLCDPSTSDVTGRILECLGLLLTQKRCSRSQAQLQGFRAASQKAISFLLAQQEGSGAWWGRWGVNYVYGTSNVLRGLAFFAHTDCRIRNAISKAVAWMKSIQNVDGGWGEHVESYRHRELIGKGKSTPSQTAWGVMALLPYCSRDEPAIQRGISYLVKTQTETVNDGASWPVGLYTGTGFPNVLYLEYTMYQHYFPMAALSKYLQSRELSVTTTIQPRLHEVELLRQPHVLIMALGSRGDVQICLRMAQILATRYKCRVRLATHPKYKNLVESHSIEFHSVGGDPMFYANFQSTKTGLIPWIKALTGAIEPIRRSICLMSWRFWTASVDPPSDNVVSKAHQPSFIADIVVSNMFSYAHVHCAEQLQVPLIFLDAVPLFPTRSFPYHPMCSGNRIPDRAWWSLLSYYCFELFTWLCIGRFVNHLRSHEYGMSQLSTVWATFRVLTANITHVGLWSRHLIPRPGDWGPNMIVAGSAHSPQVPYQPSQSLVDFLNSDVPIIAISFGSFPVPMPQRVLSVIFKAVQLARVKAVFCLGGSTGHGVQFDPRYTHIVDEIPHDWLLPQVDGFFHHGGAGHVASGLKHGVPTLIMPLAFDQGYWAARVASLKIGPAAVDYKLMTPESLADAFIELLSEDFKTRSKYVGLKVSQERDGSEVAAEVVAESLSSCGRPNCAVIPVLPAVWKHHESEIHVSGAVAACLVYQGVAIWEEFVLPAAFDWTEEWKRVQSQMPMFLVFLESSMTLVIWIFSIIGRFGRTKTRQQKLAATKSSKRVEGKIRQSEQALRMLLHQAEDRSTLESNIVRNWKRACDVSMKELLRSSL